MSNSRDTRVAICADCCSSLPLTDTSHVCLPMRRRRMMERMVGLLDACEDGRGVLWLVRVIYRERCKMGGLGVYGDRAELARRVCWLLEGDDA